MKLVNYILFSLILIIAIGCQHQSEEINFDPFNDISGKWIIQEVYLTNGPICYDIKSGNTINILTTHNDILLQFKVFSKLREELFNLEAQSKEMIIGYGFLNNPITDFSNNTKQRLIIKFELPYLDLTISYQTNSFDNENSEWGDVAHFKILKSI